MRVEILKCDRCGVTMGEAEATGDTPAEAETVDLLVFAPWCPAAEKKFEDLCDTCRTTILGYLANILKVERDDLATSAGLASRVRGQAAVVIEPGDKGSKLPETRDEEISAQLAEMGLDEEGEEDEEDEDLDHDEDLDNEPDAPIELSLL